MTLRSKGKQKAEVKREDEVVESEEVAPRASTSTHKRFDGHRRMSWCAGSKRVCSRAKTLNRVTSDIDELTEIRARSR
jgi:endonuclease I